MTHMFFDHPFFLGSDEFKDMLGRLAKPHEHSYPPYNIEVVDDVTMLITVAVAGFRMEDLQILQEDNRLIVKGKIENSESKNIFIHRGIATRQFVRQFCLSEGLEPKGARIDNGLLYITIKRKPQQKIVKQIEIQHCDYDMEKQVPDEKIAKGGACNISGILLQKKRLSKD